MRLKGIQVPQIILQMQEQQIISIRLSFLYSLGTDEKGNRDICFIKIRSYLYMLLNLVYIPFSKGSIKIYYYGNHNIRLISYKKLVYVTD